MTLEWRSERQTGVRMRASSIVHNSRMSYITSSGGFAKLAIGVLAKDGEGRLKRHSNGWSTPSLHSILRVGPKLDEFEYKYCSVLHIQHQSATCIVKVHIVQNTMFMDKIWRNETHYPHLLGILLQCISESRAACKLDDEVYVARFLVPVRVRLPHQDLSMTPRIQYMAPVWVLLKVYRTLESGGGTRNLVHIWRSNQLRQYKDLSPRVLLTLYCRDAYAIVPYSVDTRPLAVLAIREVERVATLRHQQNFGVGSSEGRVDRFQVVESGLYAVTPSEVNQKLIVCYPTLGRSQA